MGLRRAVVVDRDAMLLARLSSELGRAGYAVETLASTLGLTPDLVALSSPELVVVDAELPGMGVNGLLVLTRSLKARRAVRVVVSTEGEAEPLRARVGADQAVPRASLLSQGARLLGVDVETVPPLDVRAVIDEVLGGRPVALAPALEVKVDLFGKSNLYVGADGKLQGVFVATSVFQPVGQKLELRLHLNTRARLTLNGEVAWQRAQTSFGGRVAAGVGVRLVELSAEQRTALEQFLELREPITWGG